MRDLQSNVLHEPFSLKKGLLLHDTKLFITQDLREKVMYESHDPPYVGHQGIQATTNAIENYFYWPSIKKDIKDYASHCLVCQKVKYD